jgi:hypothetical protein
VFPWIDGVTLSFNSCRSRFRSIIHLRAHYSIRPRNVNSVPLVKVRTIFLKPNQSLILRDDAASAQPPATRASSHPPKTSVNSGVGW